MHPIRPIALSHKIEFQTKLTKPKSNSSIVPTNSLSQFKRTLWIVYVAPMEELALLRILNSWAGTLHKNRRKSMLEFIASGVA